MYSFKKIWESFAPFILMGLYMFALLLAGWMAIDAFFSTIMHMISST